MKCSVHCISATPNAMKGKPNGKVKNLHEDQHQDLLKYQDNKEIKRQGATGSHGLALIGFYKEDVQHGGYIYTTHTNEH